MRVLLTGIELTGSGYAAGQFLPTLQAALGAEGVDARLVLIGDGEPLAGEAIHWIPIPPRQALMMRRGPAAVRAVMHLRAARMLREVISEEEHKGFDVLHAHWCFPSGLALQRGRASVLTVHGADVKLMEQSALGRRMAAAAARRCSVLTAVSPALAAAVQSCLGVSIPEERVRGMPVELGTSVLTEGGGGALVLCPLESGSRVSLAVDAAACLAALDRPLPLVIAGDGPELESLRRHAERRGISELVHFAGRPDDATLATLLSRADVLLDPALGIGFARHQALAAMAGVPIVACWDGGGTLKWRARQPLLRLVVPSGEAIADAVLDLLAAPDGLAQRREAGSLFRVHLAASSVARKCTDWYHEALKAPTAPYH